MEEKITIIHLQCTEHIKGLAKQLASENGMSLSAWVRYQIITEARRQGITTKSKEVDLNG